MPRMVQDKFFETHQMDFILFSYTWFIQGTEMTRYVTYSSIVIKLYHVFMFIRWLLFIFIHEVTIDINHLCFGMHSQVIFSYVYIFYNWPRPCYIYIYMYFLTDEWWSWSRGLKPISLRLYPQSICNMHPS